MNRKMLLKVTLNEALDPELFEYLVGIENARIRAGAFRALASAAARSKRVTDFEHQSVQVPIPTKIDSAIILESEIVLASPREAKLTTTDSVPQFLDDEIGDQFARF